MNVIVNRAEMIGLAANYRFECRDNFVRARFRGAVRTPESPGMQVHSGLGEQRCSIETVGGALYYFARSIAILLRGGEQTGIRNGGRECSGLCLGRSGMRGMLLREGRNGQRKNEGEQGQDAAVHSEPPVDKWDDLVGGL